MRDKGRVLMQRVSRCQLRGQSTAFRLIQNAIRSLNGQETAGAIQQWHTHWSEQTLKEPQSALTQTGPSVRAGALKSRAATGEDLSPELESQQARVLQLRASLEAEQQVLMELQAVVRMQISYGAAQPIAAQSGTSAAKCVEQELRELLQGLPSYGGTEEIVQQVEVQRIQHRAQAYLLCSPASVRC